MQASKRIPMRYRVALHHDEEGVSVSVPGLPGCWSEGRDEAEALVNVTDAVRRLPDEHISQVLT
jgi:predicted RNase H-like HicB family nuclease